ncbi:Hypothetical_protein [Hexamita inflata]|uniref:Hypothetical_protein n=1 Tax=Hexamita inflata TaxID=28002 RepID=A0AA86NST2_9EUKA|nr:Hypothetical protein HINF_LOCUS12664 [Hexamita inflata]
MNMSTMYGNAVFQLSICLCYAKPWKYSDTILSEINTNSTQSQQATVQTSNLYNSNMQLILTKQSWAYCIFKCFQQYSVQKLEYLQLSPLIFAIQCVKLLYEYHRSIQNTAANILTDIVFKSY